jgi:branched-chain amino acid aminotransferase
MPRARHRPSWSSSGSPGRAAGSRDLAERRVTTLVMIDGRVVAPDSAAVSVFDRGFLYGDSVFETIAPMAVSHSRWPSTSNACTAAPSACSSSCGAARDDYRGIRQAVGRREIGSYIRAMVTRGSAARLDSIRSDPLRVIIVGPLSSAQEAYEQGIAVVSYRTRRAAEDTVPWAPRSETIWLPCSPCASAPSGRRRGAGHRPRRQRRRRRELERVRRLRRQAGDAPEEAGILAGITRAHLLGVARARPRVALEPCRSPGSAPPTGLHLSSIRNPASGSRRRNRHRPGAPGLDAPPPRGIPRKS